jgi:hypothetical protein
MNNEEISGFIDKETVQILRQWFQERIPALYAYFRDAREEYGDIKDGHAVFILVIRPYIERMRETGGNKELTYIWDLLEQLAGQATPAVKNELYQMMDELELCDYYRYMGPLLRKRWLDTITWFPERRGPDWAMNAHVDGKRYAARWNEEITKVGGFERLDTASIIRIREKLWAEFGIEG